MTKEYLLTLHQDPWEEAQSSVPAGRSAVRAEWAPGTRALGPSCRLWAQARPGKKRKNDFFKIKKRRLNEYVCVCVCVFKSGNTYHVDALQLLQLLLVVVDGDSTSICEGEEGE